MPDLLVRSFAPLLLAFQSCFTQPSFHSFWALSCAWILCSGRRSLTRIILSAQLTQFKHYCSFHRFFSQARWNLDDLGRCVFQLLLPFCADVLVGAVDDTLARKSGRHIWGARHAPRSPALHPETTLLRFRPQLRGLLFASGLAFRAPKTLGLPHPGPHVPQAPDRQARFRQRRKAGRFVRRE